MLYEFLPKYIDIMTIDSVRSRVVNNLTGSEFIISSLLAQDLSQLDGNTDFLELCAASGMSTERSEALLDQLIKYGIVREQVSYFSEDDDTGFLMLWRPASILHTPINNVVIKALNYLISTMVIPLILIAAYCLVECPKPDAKIDLWWMISIVFSAVFGTIAHECGHIISGLAYGAPVYEAGLLLINSVIAGAYALIDDEIVSKRFQKAQIFAAGIEVNLVMGSLFVIIGTCISSSNIILMGLMNYSLGLSNLAPCKSLDGSHIIKALAGGRLDFSDFAARVFGNRALLRHLLVGEGMDGIIAVSIACAVRLSQVLLIGGSIAVMII